MLSVGNVVALFFTPVKKRDVQNGRSQRKIRKEMSELEKRAHLGSSQVKGVSWIDLKVAIAN